MEFKELKPEERGKKDHIKVYMLTHRKKKVQSEAERLGMSDSQFFIMVLNYWLQANHRDVAH